MQSPYRHVHLIGIGGIHVSAIAKLLLSLGVKISGSDIANSELTEELRTQGVQISIGHAPENVPAKAEAIIFSSAAQETNPERVEGKKRKLPEFNSHQFLGLLGKDSTQVVVTGTHGKSTTTAMLAVMAKACELHPTVVVGTKVPQLTEGNIEIGTSDLLIVEGDEFDHHFLAYHPSILLINNIEADHFDIYPTLEAMLEAYSSLLSQVVEGGWIIANGNDERVQALLKAEQRALKARKIKVLFIGTKEGADFQVISRVIQAGEQMIEISSKKTKKIDQLKLTIPGEMNMMNAVMCYAASRALGCKAKDALNGLTSFQGIWRRLEKVADQGGIVVFSDYGHHPTAVTKTVEAVREFYPDHRVVLCFQPHHRNRTKNLFQEFITCFDQVDALLLCEIYDVAGRDQTEDGGISSKDLVDAIQRYDADRGINRTVMYTKDAQESLEQLQHSIQTGDVVLIMGAGDLYKIASDVLLKH